MKIRYPNKIREWFHEHTGLFFSLLFFGFGLLCIGLYLNHFFPDSENFLIGHMGVAFMEIALTIIIVEEVVKPLRESKEATYERWNKKKQFVKKLERNSIDVLIWDFLEQYERQTNILHLERIEEIGEEDKNGHRLAFLGANERYFTYFDMLRPYGGDGSKSSVMEEHMNEFFTRWEMYFGEGIHNLTLLVSKPQLTENHSWDYLVEFYALLRRYQQGAEYLLQDMTKEQQLLQLYIRALQLYSTLLLDCSYYKIRSKNSHVLNPVNIAFAEKASVYWRMEQA